MKVVGYGSAGGVDNERYNSNNIESNVRNEINIPEDAFVFAFVGRIVKDKGINELVAAFDNINRKYHNTHLLLVGPVETVQNPVDESTLKTIEYNANIHTVGMQKDVRPYLKASDAFILPSYREGFGMVLIEAGAMGLQCITTDITGCNEIIVPGENGAIIEPRNMEALREEMEKWGERWEEKYGRNYDYPCYRPEPRKDEPKKPESKGKRPEKKNLLFDANWNGFEAGLNMLFNMPVGTASTNNGAQGLGLRPLRSWYFGFNIADVGIAFSKRHIVGLFTGVGIGWNNFSWNNDITVEYNPENVVYTIVPTDPNRIVKNTKNGTLFLQVPLMLEIRPTRKMYIDAGVTGGLRIAQWNRVKYADGSQIKNYYTARVNQFKLDASLRVGGRNLGFFANYAILPMFDMSDAKVHPLSFGFSINF